MQAYSMLKQILIRIGQGSIIAAGSVVTKDIPRYVYAAGVPAEVVKLRFTPEQIMTHESLLKRQHQAKTANGGWEGERF